MWCYDTSLYNIYIYIYLLWCYVTWYNIMLCYTIWYNVIWYYIIVRYDMLVLLLVLMCVCMYIYIYIYTHTSLCRQDRGRLLCRIQPWGYWLSWLLRILPYPAVSCYDPAVSSPVTLDVLCILPYPAVSCYWLSWLLRILPYPALWHWMCYQLYKHIII